MATRLPVTKTDYSLQLRFRKINGDWEEWGMKGKGKFETIELVQKQIRTLAAAYFGREKEVRFEWNGTLCDFTGQPTGKVIVLK